MSIFTFNRVILWNGYQMQNGMQKKIEKQEIEAQIAELQAKLKNVTIYTGTYDILNPDTKEFAEQAKTENVNITVKEYEKASHIWILRSKDELATSAYKSLIEDLKNNTVE